MTDIQDHEPRIQEPTPQPPKQPKERSLGLSTTQVAGSALAAMSGAFFASWAGTAGTLIGAALGSVIATVGAATYTWSLRRTSDAVKRTAAQVRTTALSTNALPRLVSAGPLRQGDETAADQAGEQPTEERPWWRRVDLPWAKVAVACLVVMVLGMAGITTVEAITGKPIGSLLGRDAGTGTTVGHVVGTDSSPKRSSHPKHTTPTPTTKPSTAPSQQAQPTQPLPSTVPTPSTGPSTEPTPTPPADSQGTTGQTTP